MFPFPRNTHGGLPPPEPKAGSRSHVSRGRRPAQAEPRVAKSQSLRLALSERMCDIEIQPAMPFRAPARGWQPAYVPQGGVITPPAARSFPRWDTMGYGDHLFLIKAFAKTCIAASTGTASAFDHTARGWKANRFGKCFIEVAPVIEFWSRARRDDARFDPQVQLAVDVFQQVGLLGGTAMGSLGQVEHWFAQGYAATSVAVMTNAFVSELRKRGQQASTARTMQRHKDAHAARGREIRSYLTRVLKHHPECDVMRFELCMGCNSKLNQQEEYDFMLEAAACYLRELKKVFGEAIVADIRKTDRGNKSGYLVHVLLAFEGPGTHELMAIRHTVATQWSEQTQGVGYVMDCDAVEAFMYRGAGSPLGYGESTANQLTRAVSFLVDTDSMIQVGFDGMRDGLIFGAIAG